MVNKPSVFELSRFDCTPFIGTYSISVLFIFYTVHDNKHAIRLKYRADEKLRHPNYMEDQFIWAFAILHLQFFNMKNAIFHFRSFEKTSRSLYCLILHCRNFFFIICNFGHSRSRLQTRPMSNFIRVYAVGNAITIKQKNKQKKQKQNKNKQIP